jgi:hypothetical protein
MRMDITGRVCDRAGAVEELVPEFAPTKYYRSTFIAGSILHPILKGRDLLVPGVEKPGY